MKTLININEKYRLNDILGSRWKEVQTNLTPYPIGEYGFKIGKDVDLLESHRHFSHLMMIYPLKNIDAKTNQALIQKSLTHWLTVPGNGLAPWSRIAAAGINTTLNNGEKSRELLNESMYSFSANTMYREAGQCAETPYFWVKVFADMMVNCKTDTLQILPAIPKSWTDISYKNLRIYGAFLVSATLKSGKISQVKIISEKGGFITLEKKNLGNYYNKIKTIIISENKDYLLLNFQKGGNIEISKEANTTSFLDVIFSKSANYNLYGKKNKWKI